MLNVLSITTRIGEEAEAKNAFEITDIGILLKNILNIGLIIAAILALAYLIWGAIDWLMSEGDQEKLKNAKNKILHAMAGMGILAASYAMIQLAKYVFGFDILSFEWPTPN